MFSFAPHNAAIEVLEHHVVNVGGIRIADIVVSSKKSKSSSSDSILNSFSPVAANVPARHEREPRCPRLVVLPVFGTDFVDLHADSR